MAVRIRLSRAGRKNHPYWRIVAIDSRKQREGAYLQKLGTYDPIRHEMISLDLEGVAKWVSCGAQCSDTVARLVKTYKQSQQPAA